MQEEEKTAQGSSVSMWPGIAAGTVIGVIAFVLSFDALRLVFVACGINPWLSWGGPVCVDGTILLCTWATWGFRKAHIRGAWYPWLGLVLFSGFSIAGNALHAMLGTGVTLPAWVPPLIMSIPPVALLYATHLIVIIAADRLDKTTRTTTPSTGLEPTMGAEPVAVAETEAGDTAVPQAGHDDGERTDETGDADGLTDLFDWRVPVPRMGGQEPPAPKAFGGDDIMGVTPATTDNDDVPATSIPTTGGEDTGVADQAVMADDGSDIAGAVPEADGPDAGQADPVDPADTTGPAPDPVQAEPGTVTGGAPASADVDGSRDVDTPDQAVGAGDGETGAAGADAGHVDVFPRPALHGESAADRDWMAWDGWARAHGIRPDAERAVEDGLAGSVMVARRKFRQLGLAGR